MNVRAAMSQTGARRSTFVQPGHDVDEGMMRSPTTARQQKTDLLNANVSFPSSVKPAHEGFPNITLTNDALFISPTDPDHCHEGRSTFGYAVNATLLINGEIVDSLSACVLGGTPGETENRVLSFVAPSVPNDTEIETEVRVEFAGSGINHSTHTATIVVSEDAPQHTPECDQDADCPKGQVCRRGACRDCGFFDSLFKPGPCGGSPLDDLTNVIIALAILAVALTVVTNQ